MSSPYTKWLGPKSEKIFVSSHILNENIMNHQHDFMEIAYVEKGSCTHIFNKNKTMLIPGDVIIIPPDHIHSYEITCETIIHNCLFYPDVLKKDWDALKLSDAFLEMFMIEPFYRYENISSQVMHLSIDNSKMILDNFQKIKKLNCIKPSLYKLEKKAILIEILLTLIREYEKSNTKDVNLLILKDYIKKAIQYMEKNYTSKINPSSIAESCYLSPAYFTKKFKEATGLSPNKYINNLRIKDAQYRLKNTNDSITKISQSVAIHDINYFSRLFKNITGMTPSQYRNKK